MTNSTTLKTVLEKSNLDYKTYISLNSKFRTYIHNCVHYGIINPSGNLMPGDVVVRRLGKSIDTDSYGVPLKWKIIGCPYGLIIGRKILSKKLGRIEVVNDDVYSNAGVVVDVDPDYIDSILLGEDNFNPNAQRDLSIKLRKNASKYNKSISKKISSLEDAELFFESVSAGDTIYAASSLIGLTTNPRLFVVIEVIKTIDSIDSFVVRLKSSVQITIKPRSILKFFVTTEQPYPLSKILSK